MWTLKTQEGEEKGKEEGEVTETQDPLPTSTTGHDDLRVRSRMPGSSGVSSLRSTCETKTYSNTVYLNLLP